eukprot:11834420-Alexandrium_andersonii.AAC.1
MPRRMAMRSAGGYRAARGVFLAPSSLSCSCHLESDGDSPSFTQRRPTRLSTSGAELAQRVGFRTSSPPPPADASSETCVPKRHICPTAVSTRGSFNRS